MTSKRLKEYIEQKKKELGGYHSQKIDPKRDGSVSMISARLAAGLGARVKDRRRKNLREMSLEILTTIVVINDFGYSILEGNAHKIYDQLTSLGYPDQMIRDIPFFRNYDPKK